MRAKAQDRFQNETFLKARENFWFLRDGIMEHWDEDADVSHGQLHFIKDNVVADRVISKYRKRGKPTFLKYFYRDVLGIYGRGYSKDPSLALIEDYFGEGLKKCKYDFRPQQINKYLNKEENEAEIRKEIGASLPWERLTGKQDYFYPKLLIERLLTVTYQSLKQYFKCDESKIRKPNSKKEKYFQFLSVACQYEIFVRKFLGDASFENAEIIYEECNKKVDEVTRSQEHLQKMMDAYKKAEGEENENEKKRLEEELRVAEQDACDDMETMMDSLLKLMLMMRKTIDYYKHISNLAAFSTIITIIEYRNINVAGNLAKYLKATSGPLRLRSDAFDKEQDFLFMSNVTMNKNLKDFYGAFKKTVDEDRVLQELCGSSPEIRLHALQLIKQYFKMVQSGEYMEDEKAFSDVVNEIAWKCIKVSVK